MKRPPPELWIAVPLEGRARSIVVAHSAEDERRLRSWLARSESARAALRAVLDSLDQLDNLDGRAA